MNTSKLANLRLLLYISLTVWGCISEKDRVHQERRVKRTYYEDGGVRAEATYNSDSLKDGYGKLFYPNGKLELEVAYQDGKKEGYERGYYQNGNIKYIGSSKNGYSVGQGLNFYQDSVLKSYVFFDPIGRVVYKKANDNRFSVNDSLKVRIYAPTPPDSEVELLVEITSIVGEAIEERKIDTDQGLAIYSTVLRDTGVYYFTTRFIFKDLHLVTSEEYENNFQYWVENE